MEDEGAGEGYDKHMEDRQEEKKNREGNIIKVSSSGKSEALCP